VLRFTELREDAGFWRKVSAVLGVVALALLVAALIRRPPPDFSTRRTVAVLRDGAQHPLWTIRLAAAAHEIAADSVAPPPVRPGRVYQLWLLDGGANGLQPIGLLPETGQKVIPLTQENAQRLRGAGQLVVTLEPAGGSQQPWPTGPVRFRGSFDGSAEQ
jgi:anti-sigma-K factor RskA